jgi:tetratricopeptide (TPR) repeat protein
MSGGEPSNIWRICLLSSPRATFGDKTIRPQAKEAWGVLASLLLPPTLASDSFPDTLAPCSRDTLALRFWQGKENPRAHLRQAFAFLQKTFPNTTEGVPTFLADRNTIEAAPGRFITDIEEILTCYRRALAALSLEEKIQYLCAAEAMMQGDFLAGCIQPGKAGELWVHNRRVEVTGKMVRILMTLVEALTEAGQLQAALDIACRVMHLQPEHAAAKQCLWDLAAKTGQPSVAETIEAIASIEAQESFTSVMARLPKQGNPLTLPERRRFHSLFLAEWNALPPKLRQPFLRLAVFPASFTADLARAVCRVPRSLLRYLVQTPLLYQEGEDYLIPEAVRACAWSEVPTTTKRRLRKNLALCCENWVRYVDATDPTDPPAPFHTTARAEPFFRAALEWHFTQSPTRATATLLQHLHTLKLGGLIREFTPEIVRLCSEEAIPPPIRFDLLYTAGYEFVHVNDFPRAIACLEKTLELETVLPDEHTEYRNHRVLLASALHYAGETHRALPLVVEVIDHFERTGNQERLPGVLRVLSEMQNHLGNFEAALHSSEQALALRRAIGTSSRAIADALFWKGSTLHRLKRSSEATACIQEALSLWMETEDTTGIGHCLRLLGRLRAEAGNIIEAKAHLRHSILLHERTGNVGCRIAAVEALADVHFSAKEFAQARPYYEECLSYVSSHQPERTARREHFQEKIACCLAW